jgi:alpha-tubulin suppressor-like RCC1 family protein
MLGDGTSTASSTPVMVTGLPPPVTEVSAGRSHVCALAAGDVYCWGDDSSEQLGNGAAGSSATAVKVLTGASDVFAGGDHTCAAAGGTAYCWGHNDGPGALGNGTDLPTNGPTPGAVVNLTGVSRVTDAGYHACAIDSGGAWCWGTGTSGELGDGTTTTKNYPVAVTGLSANVIAIQVGGGPSTQDTSCAVMGGGLWCWGAGDYGRSGFGDANNRSTAAQVPGLSQVIMVSVGWYHTCAVAGGDAGCWGMGNSGQLGDGASTTGLVPVIAVRPP